MAASYLFLFGCFAAVHAVLALVRLRRPAALAMAFFLSGWVTMELALLHLAWQVPVVGLLVALGGLDAAVGRWGLALTVASWVGFLAAWLRTTRARAVVDRALADLPPAGLPVPPARRLRAPWRHERPDVVVERDLPYGDHDRHVLDVYRRRDLPHAAPTLVTVHGGGWTRGSKDRQAQPLAWRLAAEGWTVAAVNYRLSPAATFPEPVIDVKRALAWLRERATEHGVDPRTVFASGGSAGAHLAAIAALTPGRPDLQPGFEDADTSVAGCVPLYGTYDVVPARQPVAGGAPLAPLLARDVLKAGPDDAPELWDLASPVTLVGPAAPPFLVVHGSLDTVLLAEGARRFVQGLRAAGAGDARLVEVPGAQHALDVFHNRRSEAVVAGIIRWLTHRAKVDATASGVVAVEH